MYFLRLLLCLVAIFSQTADGIHLTGTWRTSEFFKFLCKFGIQKTDPGKLADTQGFIYGNALPPGGGYGPHTVSIVVTVFRLAYNMFH